MSNEINRTEIDIRIVFDVGANIGITSNSFLQEFSGAEVHAFEPVAANFRKLEQISNTRLTVNKLALGAQSGQLKIYLDENPEKHSTVVIADINNYENVEVTTLDDYCEANGTYRIGLLKIDTEGADLAVLNGAKKFLKGGQIDFILVESAFYQKQRHVHLCDFLNFLGEYKYDVFGVYEQSLEWDYSARVQYSNILFARNGIKISQ